ncbi:hypothetical protein K2173_009527 [Erythroxylum novogranatense]|uniref:Anoctamin transmembrane domain-containing protein n=1 Tax=Erythroxylum novogranatense TaxID=1862640 RepID=A0AAV8U480_9ROSI|nr:hypothetical protein K2173_009527 [Erythroxylum novogranatense]
MNADKEEQPAFEICLVVPKRTVKEEDESCDCIEVLEKELRNSGFMIERAVGISDDFIKLAAPLKTLGRAASELRMKKPTYIGMDLQFEWREVDAFFRQPDGSLFTWCERFQCYCHLLYGIVNNSKFAATLRLDDKGFLWGVGESLVKRLESQGVVKQVFPLHDEVKKKQLLKSWVLNWRDVTNQPIDDMYLYFGLKIAVYFSFLRMYTRWLIFPAVLGLMVQLVDFRSLQMMVLPVFLICIILWAVLFFQFWKRKNSALLARWQINSFSDEQGLKLLSKEWGLQSSEHAQDIIKVKQAYQRNEWLGQLVKLRNNSIVILSIICLQLPFELAYAHLYDVTASDAMRFGLTAVYLVVIQYFTRIGGKVSVKLIQYENNDNREYCADSLVYKVFGLYFMQSYIGVFYHAISHRNFKTLRKVLIQRLIIYQVFENLLENSLPYFKYSYKKFSAFRNKKIGHSIMSKIKFNSKAEKEYLKPTYAASIGEELEDGLFDDYLELALQFGMAMMFACAFPIAFVFAAVNGFTEIRADTVKLLTMVRRPIPRATATIGAWFNIFQFLIVMSICTNSVLLVCLYDQEGKWKIEPGLLTILIIEHILLIIKFVFSHFVPEEPAWVRAKRAKNTTHAQEICHKQLLRSFSGGKRHWE